MEDAQESSDSVVTLKLSVSNVVCVASVQCSIRLKELARTGLNVEYIPYRNVMVCLG